MFGGYEFTINNTGKDFDLTSHGLLNYALSQGIGIGARRTVRSGTESISSNYVAICPTCRLSNNIAESNPKDNLNGIDDKTLINTIVSSVKMYPNPTSELINFDVDVDKSAKVRIMLFSLDLSVNDVIFNNYIDSKKVIKYQIPNHYRSGFYRYKVFINNEEFKDGNLIIK